MGNDESNSNPEKDKSPPKKPKRKIAFQSKYIKSIKITPLNKNIIDDLSSPQNKQNNETNFDINETDWVIISGNNSQGNKIKEKTEDLEYLNVDIPKPKEKRRPKKLSIDTKNMSNKIEEEKNNESSIVPKMSISKNFYNNKINYNKNDEEEDKKEEKKISKNKNSDEKKVVAIKSISENFQINNEDKIDDNSINDNNIKHKKSIGVRKRKKKRKYI